MSLSPGAQEFLVGVGALPTGGGMSHLIDKALAPALAEEAELRRLFASDRKNQKLSDPYAGLVDVFNASNHIKVTRARVVQDDVERSAKFVLPLSEPKEDSGERNSKKMKYSDGSQGDLGEEEEDNETLNAQAWKLRRKEGASCMVDNLQDFQKNWAVFSEGSLSQLTDWSNVVAAGGSVLACLTPIPGNLGNSRRGMRKYFHHNAFPTSDVDLFLYGLTLEEAEKKIVKIYEAVRDSIPWETTCIRTKHAISIHSQYPYRPVQIVLRLYYSPAEILAGFDIDAPCVLYNGSSVFANPRAIAAMMRQCNTIDVTRRSPSYEVRLVKYAYRGFEVYIPDLKRDEIDPTIFERAIYRIEGLARLLVLEKLTDAEERDGYLYSRRSLRSRPPPSGGSSRSRRGPQYKGDLKWEEDDMLSANSNYDPGTLHIPYGPGWTAKRIATLVYKTDLGMNSTFNPKNKRIRLHRHPAFFGNIEECMTDCCEKCPAPANEEETTLYETYSKSYVEGRISFIQEDPGRQSMTGSFNPIDAGEWSAKAYLGATDKFFTAISKHDRATVQSMLADKSVDIQRRDHVGRTALHLAIMVKAADICKDLIDAGSRISARVVDGRNCLHLAAQHGLRSVVEALLAKSKQNEEERDRIKLEKERLEKEKNDIGDESEIEVDDEMEVERQEDEDEKEQNDGADEDDENENEGDDEEDEEDDSDDEPRRGRKVVIAVGDKQEVHDTADIPEDNTEEPDILNINQMDWDLDYSPIAFAIVSGSLDCVNALLTAGADVELKLTTKSGVSYSAPADVQYLVLTCKTLPSAHIFSRFSSASEFELNVTVPIFNRLLESGATTSQADKNLASIFHYLVAAGRAPLVIQALSNDPNARVAMNTPTRIGYYNPRWLYPLATAVERDDFAMVLTLLALGVKLEMRAEDIDRAKQVIQSMSGSDGDISRYAFKIQDIIQPVEIALAKRSPLVHLLSGAGVQVSAVCRETDENRTDKPRFSLLDWAHEAVEVLTSTMEEKAKKEPDAETKEVYCAFPDDAGSTWQQARFYQQKLMADYRKRENVRSSREPIDENQVEERKKDLVASIEYFKEAEAALRESGAMTWKELYPTFDKPLPSVTPVTKPNSGTSPKKTELPVPQRPGYEFVEMSRSSPSVPNHLFEAYDALFEACHSGDTGTIRKLCMPRPPSAPGQEPTPPIQISVTMNPYSDDDHIEERGYSDGVYSTLGVALLARKWETAREIMEIVKAQHKKPEKKVAEFSTKSIRLTAEEEDEEMDEDEEDDDDDGNNNNPLFQMTDVAAPLPMMVQCAVTPLQMLRTDCSARMSRDGKTYLSRDEPLEQAVREGDVEVFKEIYDLYASFVDHEDISGSLPSAHTVLECDSPEILDEYIRRTGWGIELPAPPEEELKKKREEEESKIYLGLNVNGKKRKDLATDGRLDYSHPTITPPLWEAVTLGAKKVMEYFSTSKPLEAYKYFAGNEDNELAKYITKLIKDDELENQLPVLIGAKAASGADGDEAESPKSLLTHTFDVAGARDDILEIVQLLMRLYPSEVQAALKNKNFKNRAETLLSVFVVRFDPKLMKHLMSNGFSVELVDHRGWNLLHFICNQNHIEAWEWFSANLPKETFSQMLLQTSRDQKNTPLMIAVKEANLTFVKKFLCVNDRDTVRNSLLLRDANGFLPLHAAVRKGYAKIAKLLLDQKDYPAEMLHAENGVGETPLDTATALWLLQATSESNVSIPSDIPALGVGELQTYQGVTKKDKIEPETRQQYTSSGLEKKLGKFRKVVRNLGDRISANAELKTTMEKFIGIVEAMVAYTKKREAETEPGGQDKPKNRKKVKVEDYEDRTEVLEVIAGAMKKRPAHRKLVHVADVLISVKSSLESVVKYSDGVDPQL